MKERVRMRYTHERVEREQKKVKKEDVDKIGVSTSALDVVR